MKIDEYNPLFLLTRFLTSVLEDAFHRVVANRVTVVYEIDAPAEVVSGLVQELEKS
jgi:hypothetical protein